jgi:hypothetical protein
VTAHLFASAFTAAMAKSAAGYAFFAGDDMCSGFRFGAAADDCIAHAAATGTTIDEMSTTTATAAGRVLLAV